LKSLIALPVVDFRVLQQRGENMREEESKPNPDDVRTEYAALIDFHNSVVSHRFTLVGFYLAAIGLIAGKDVNFLEACLILGLTISMYMMELRNRTLYTQMGRRAIAIEVNYWKLNRKDNGDTGLPLFCTMRQSELPEEIRKTLTSKQHDDLEEHPRFWGRWKIPLLQANHSRGLDFLYAVVAVYAITKMIFS
jgi:hypothetical protein